MSEGPTAAAMRRKLAEAFAPATLEVIDDSARHAGHAGSRDGGETHFNLVIVSEAFQGLSRVERQRRVNRVLAEELAGPVHALSIRALAPGESSD
jgi:BolA protein